MHKIATEILRTEESRQILDAHWLAARNHSDDVVLADFARVKAVILQPILHPNYGHLFATISGVVLHTHGGRCVALGTAMDLANFQDSWPYLRREKRERKWVLDLLEDTIAYDDRAPAYRAAVAERIPLVEIAKRIPPVGKRLGYGQT